MKPTEETEVIDKTNAFFLNVAREYNSVSLETRISDDIRARGRASYWALFRDNREFRLFICSYMITHSGEWFTYVASITMIEEILGTDAQNSKTAISFLVVLRLCPNILLSPFGGVLADSHDRRVSMIMLDILGSFNSFLYILAYHLRSIGTLYLVTLTEACICAVYEPSRSAIVPLLVPDEDFLKKAVTLTGLVWSTMTTFGAGLGGVATDVYGIQICFILDGATYLASAFLMWRVRGTYNASEEREYNTIWERIQAQSVDGVKYLRSSFFGPLIFIKASASLAFGAADVLNVAFSERYKNPPELLGMIFASVGIGCALGPLLIEPWTDMNRPRSLQKACVWSFASISAGYLGLGLFSTGCFAALFLFSLLRASGSSILWIDSSLLLQKFSDPQMLGRVSAVDFALATICEALGAVASGWMQDSLLLSPETVSLNMALVAGVFFLVWFFYDQKGGGAANHRSDNVIGGVLQNCEGLVLYGEDSPLVSQTVY